MLCFALTRCIGYLAKQSQNLANGLTSEQKNQWYKRLLANEGVLQSRWKEAVVMLKQLEANLQSDAKGQWLLSNIHRNSQAEYALLTCIEQRGIEKRVIDRTFLDDNDTAANETLAEFAGREIKTYKAQLLHYKTLIAGLNADNIKIKTALYFPMIPHWVELD